MVPNTLKANVSAPRVAASLRCPRLPLLLPSPSPRRSRFPALLVVVRVTHRETVLEETRSLAKEPARQSASCGRPDVTQYYTVVVSPQVELARTVNILIVAVCIPTQAHQVANMPCT